MKDLRRIAALVVLASPVVAPPARADFERHCEERPLDAAEQAAAMRVLSALRSALPAAAETAPVPGKPAGAADAAPTRRKELEARRADLRRSRQDAAK